MYLFILEPTTVFVYNHVRGYIQLRAQGPSVSDTSLVISRVCVCVCVCVGGGAIGRFVLHILTRCVKIGQSLVVSLVS